MEILRLSRLKLRPDWEISITPSSISWGILITVSALRRREFQSSLHPAISDIVQTIHRLVHGGIPSCLLKNGGNTLCLLKARLQRSGSFTQADILDGVGQFMRYRHM